MPNNRVHARDPGSVTSEGTRPRGRGRRGVNRLGDGLESENRRKWETVQLPGLEDRPFRERCQFIRGRDAWLEARETRTSGSESGDWKRGHGGRTEARSESDGTRILTLTRQSSTLPSYRECACTCLRRTFSTSSATRRQDRRSRFLTASLHSFAKNKNALREPQGQGLPGRVGRRGGCQQGAGQPAHETSGPALEQAVRTFLASGRCRAVSTRRAMTGTHAANENGARNAA